MATLLKDGYSAAYINNLAQAMQQAYPAFDKTLFVKKVLDGGWPQKELKQRMRHITYCLHHCLPLSYVEQLTVLKKVAPQFTGYLALYFPDFIEVFGISYPDISVDALAYFTQYSSSEFAVRPYIIAYQKMMIKQHLKWAKSNNHHIRRLASEGLRPRLPWAQALPLFKKDPSPILPILQQLKQDESEYVRKSVANCLNDISKDHPNTMLRIVNEWKNTSPHTDWIIKHASRSLLKQGHTEALSSFGLNPAVKIEASPVELNKNNIELGETLIFGCQIASKEKKQVTIRVEYKLYFMKGNGKQQGKVFQMGSYILHPTQPININRKHAFINRTTRKHYEGNHRIAIIINGQSVSEASFNLIVKT
jgi:3-methyladenine DNA glycosylase AlkC